MEKWMIIEPNNPSWWEIVAKTLIWFGIWIILAILVFIILILVWWILKEAFESNSNPLLPFILIIIAFICSLVGNIIISGVYNLFFPNKYYDLWKMFSLTIIVNILLFFIIAPLYIVFFNEIKSLFIILAFNIIFSVFFSNSIIEFITNPNYAGAYMIGTTIWLSVTISIFLIIYKLSYGMSWLDSKTEILLVTPPILAYTIIPLVSNVWQKLYYKFYQMWNNFLYIPSIQEVLVDEDEIDEINIEE